MNAVDRAIRFFDICKDKGLMDSQKAIDDLLELKKELEEIKIEDTYMLTKIEESLSMGSKAQSLATVEVYQILKNRNKDNL